MNITPVSNTLSYVSQTNPGTVAEAIGIKMLDNMMEQTEIQSEEMLKAMELSVNPGLGANIDVRV